MKAGINEKLAEMKKAAADPAKREKTLIAWKDMQKASKEISKKWKGSAIEEIKSQRRKE